MSEHIDTFLAITGSSDAQTASNFLEMSNDNLETAISLFFEHGASFGQSTATSAINNNDSNTALDFSQEDLQQMDMDDDAKLAERLQNEAYQQQQQQQQDEPRAPIQATTERLVGGDVFPGVFGGIGGSFNPLLNGGNGMRQQYRDEDFFGGGRRGVFNQREDEEEEDDEEEELDEDGVPKVVELADSDEDDMEDFTRNTTTHQQRLQRLFRPPFDLISKLDLDTAKTQAHKTHKWVMVNIQDNSEFLCQCLNRDLWSQSSVKQIVRDNFIFLQYASDSRSGELYSNFYPFHEYPHIAILDPITGERVKQWTGIQPKAETFISEVKEFLKKFSLDPTKVNPVADHGKPKVDVNSLSEEQQLEYAISQSLGGKISTTAEEDQNDYDDDDELEILNTGNESDPIEIDESDDDEPVTANTKKELTEEEIIESITPQLNNEPITGSIRIQIRSGTGSRVIRKFDPENDKVLALYQFVKQHFDIPKGVFFSLTSQRENLVGKLDMGLKEAGLANAMVLLEVME